ncbi:hypothetical protein BDQ17DRAFT_1545141 [Cyathus striatus]|nr:hypothetical protein BDQ17DRAFT_1545141 [Cyathus striatus]
MKPDSASFSMIIFVHGLRESSRSLMVNRNTTIGSFLELLESEFPDVQSQYYYFTVGRRLLRFSDLSATFESLGLDNGTIIFARLRVRGGSTSYNVQFPELSPDLDAYFKRSIQISPRIYVNTISQLTAAPEYWSVPDIGVIGDAEGAQAQGFGDMVISRRLNDSTKTGIVLQDSDAVTVRLWKTCLVHFHRGILNLQAHIPEEVADYLRQFSHLKTNMNVEAYKQFCHVVGQQNKKLKDWWSHKLSYAWLLPSLNKHLSKMVPEHWDILPSNTNIIEGSHAHDNRVTAANHSVLQAILLAKELDADTARLLKAYAESGVLTNTYNSSQHRFTAQGKRKARTQRKQAELGTNAKKKRKTTSSNLKHIVVNSINDHSCA